MYLGHVPGQHCPGPLQQDVQGTQQRRFHARHTEGATDGHDGDGAAGPGPSRILSQTITVPVRRRVTNTRLPWGRVWDEVQTRRVEHHWPFPPPPTPPPRETCPHWTVVAGGDHRQDSNPGRQARPQPRRASRHTHPSLGRLDLHPQLPDTVQSCRHLEPQPQGLRPGLIPMSDAVPSRAGSVLPREVQP